MNINEIAKLADVSRATVSRYLNDGYVSEEKRARIKKVIDDTGYQPSSQAQMLRTKKTRQIGVIIPKIHSESVSRMVAGIGDRLAGDGYHLLLANTNNDEQEELKYLRLFRDNHVDGIILMGTVITKQHEQELAELKVPVVIAAQQVAGYPCLYHDDYMAARQMMEQLVKSGRCIGHLCVNQKDQAAGVNRTRAYRDVMTEAGLAVESNMVVESGFSAEQGYQAMGQLLQGYPEIDTVFCATDTVAVGALKCLADAGKKVPEEVQVAGIGGSALARLVVPGISTVSYHYKTLGRDAAAMLLDIIEGKDMFRLEVKMGSELVIRQSTRKN